MSVTMRGSQMSLGSQVDIDLRQTFTEVGTYKGSIVAIKKINKRHVDLTRNVRKELKNVIIPRLRVLLFTSVGAVKVSQHISTCGGYSKC